MALGATSDLMPVEAPAPRDRELLSPTVPLAFEQKAQQTKRASGCSCDACRGMVAHPPADGHDIISLLTCRAADREGSCGDDFCESSCKVHISSMPDASPRCREKAHLAESLSLAQLREVTRLRTSCGPPQPCTCACICPEIVWPPLLGPPFMVPTPQPFFGLIQESADAHKQKRDAPMSLLEVSTNSREQTADSAAASAAAAAQAALQKSAVQKSIVEQTTMFVHHKEDSEEARYMRHRRWLEGGGDAGFKGLVAERKRPVAAAIQTHESAATASHDTQHNLLKQNPYMMLPPPPGPPPKGPPMRHDFRPGFNVCPAHAPCNCYCHCKAPPDRLMNFKPSHDQPIFTG